LENPRPPRPNHRIWTAAVVSAAFFVPLCIFGAPALARSAAAASQYQYGGSSQYQYKVTLCHHTHSKKHPWHQITVSSHAVKAHLKHGDTLGTCPPPPPPAPVAPTTTKKHGHGDDNGHGNSQGKGNDNNSNQGSGGDHSNNGNGHGNGGGKGHH
jgi:uncharacterized membrane protein YgcG